MIVSQSVTITTKVGSSNPAHGEDYSIKFVSDLRQVGDVLREFRFLLPLNNLNYVLKYVFEHYIIYIQVDLTRKARKT